jgi:glutamyl-tRNA reductase
MDEVREIREARAEKVRQYRRRVKEEYNRLKRLYKFVKKNYPEVIKEFEKECEAAKAETSKQENPNPHFLDPTLPFSPEFR